MPGEYTKKYVTAKMSPAETEAIHACAATIGWSGPQLMRRATFYAMQLLAESTGEDRMKLIGRMVTASAAPELPF